MGEVLCCRQWDPKKLIKLIQWAAEGVQRYLVIIGDQPVPPFEVSDRLRYFTASKQNEDQILTQIAQEFLFMPFVFEGPGLERLQQIQMETHLALYDFADQGSIILKNFLQNLQQPLHDGCGLFGKLAGIAAFVCGAGPSIAKSGLRNYIDRGAVLAGGGAVEALKNLSITPHAAAHVDSEPLHRFSKTEAPVLCQLRTASSSLMSSKGSKIVFPGSGNFPLEKAIEEKLGICLPSFDGGWTVGTWLAALAYYFGCDPIILVGMDFSSAQSGLYAAGVTTPLDRERKMKVTTASGQEAVARIDWLLAHRWLEDFIRQHPDRKWINASQGVEIRGTENISLADIEFSHAITKEIFADLCRQLPVLDKSAAVHAEIVQDLERCLQIIFAILKEVEMIYPRFESGEIALLQTELSEQWLYEILLKPVWDVWRPLLSRANRDGTPGLFLHEMLLYRSICTKGLGN